MGILDSTSHVIQLLIALGGAVLIFSLAFAGYSRALFIGIVIMIPFQPIDSALWISQHGGHLCGGICNAAEQLP